MRNLARLAALAAALFATAFCAEAKSFYVDKNAGGANNGTSWTHAWKSFGAIQWGSIAPGDTLFISGGTVSKTYYETLDAGKAGTPSSRIVIRVGQDPGHNGVVVIDGQRSRHHCIELADWVTVDGEFQRAIHLVCKNARWTGITSNDADGLTVRYAEIATCGDGSAPGTYDHGIHFGHANKCEVAYCYIHHNYQDGYNASGSEGTAFGNNKVHHCTIVHNSDDGIACRNGHDIYDNVIGDQYEHPGGGSGHPDGIQAQGNYTRVWNNRIYNCQTHGVFADPLNCGAATGILIFNNTIYRTTTAMHMHAIRVKSETGTDSITGILVANNTIVDIGYGAIDIKCTNTANCAIANNIAYNCRADGDFGYVIGTDDNAGFIDYNCVSPGPSGGNRMKWAGETYDHSAFVSRGYGQSHGTTAAPQFVAWDQFDAAKNGQDFHLVYWSPCRDAGDNACIQTFAIADMEGDPRICGNKTDIGSDEYEHHLYYVGSQEPGGQGCIRVVGLPGENPVRLLSGADIQDPPLSTQYGDLHLDLPIDWAGDGTIPASGVLDRAVTLPQWWSADQEIFLQAIVGDLSDPAARLTNLLIIKVE